MLQSVITIVYGIRVAIVVIAALIALISAVRRGRPTSGKRDLAFGAAGFVAVLGIAVWAKGTPSGLAILAVAGVVGIALGFVGAKARMPLAMVTSVCIIFAMIMVVFGEPGAQAIGFYAIAFGFGIAAGQGIKPMTSKGAGTGSTPVPAEQPS